MGSCCQAHNQTTSAPCEWVAACESRHESEQSWVHALQACSMTTQGTALKDGHDRACR